MPTKILIVEDERIVALNLQQRLCKLDYEVPAIASTGEQALFFAARENPDLVLMDIHIEGDIDGIEAAQQITDLFQTPVIFLTAYSEEATIMRARATKPYGYLLKPFSERELHATIQMALERRMVDLALSRSEACKRLALDAAQMGSWELNADTQQMLSSGHRDRAFNFSGPLTDFLTLIHAEDRAAVDVALQKSIADTLPCEVDFRHIDQNGSLHWLRLQGRVFTLLPNDDTRHVIGVLQDITERKFIEGRLQQAATVFEATQDGILILDAERSVVAANRSFNNITGYSNNDLLGRIPYLLCSDVQSEHYLQELNDALVESGQWRGEIKSLDKSGAALSLLITIASVKDQHGELSYYVLTVSDLSAAHGISETTH